jgi:hypothetical protein
VGFIYNRPSKWHQIVIPYLAIGLARGEKCLYLTALRSRNQICALLKNHGVEVNTALESGSLVFSSWRQFYLTDGIFNPNRAVKRVQEATRQALAQGFNTLRITAEMTWASFRIPGSERLAEYERLLNQKVFSQQPCLALCQFEQVLFSPEALEGIASSHPVLIHDEALHPPRITLTVA